MSVRLVLCMIVKNEARVLPRLLTSVRPFVDAMMVCDTGSTDDTAQIARSFGAHIATTPWKNFGHNRTASVRLAEALVRERDWPLASTYYLFLDADMVLRAKDFDKDALTEPWYLVEQTGGALRYWNTRLGRADYVWTSVGVTHEYWSPQGLGTQARLHTLSIDDLGDGGAKADKSERDIRLLTEGLEAEPTNYRYMYYLAQTYGEVGNLPEAMRWYEKRIAAGGWEEERWHARYKLGTVCLRSDDPATQERGAGILLQAFEERPSRAEPLYALARWYRDRGKNQLAYMLAARGKEIPRPSDTLFVEEKPYAIGFDEEISITGYYVGKKVQGLAACERLIQGTDHAAAVQASRNIAHYTGQTHVFPGSPEDLAAKAPLLIRQAARLGRFKVPAMPHYNPTNPSIVVDPKSGGLLVNVRMVNYTQERGRWYVSRDEDGVIRTENVLCRWDPETGIVSHPSLLVWDKTALSDGGRIQGLEDLRLVAHDGEVWCSATCCQVPGAGGNARTVFGQVSAEDGAIDRVVPFTYDGIGTCEKNWLLYSRRGPGDASWDQTPLNVIYGHSPFKVLALDQASGTCWAPNDASSFRREGWRGGAPPFQVDGRTLLVIHEVLRLDNHNVYLHRFVELDGSAVKAYSPAFTLEHRGIEYVAGAVAHEGEIILTYGYEDREACWMSFPKELVLGMLTMPAETYNAP